MSEMSVHEVLVKARNLIDQEGWIQGPCIEPDGVCVYGACGIAAGWWGRNGYAAGRSANRELMEDAFDALSDLTPERNAIAFNDKPGRTKQDVLDLFDDAVAKTAPAPDLENVLGDEWAMV